MLNTKNINLVNLKIFVGYLKICFLSLFWTIYFWSIFYVFTSSEIEVVSDSMFINTYYLNIIYGLFCSWGVVLILSTVKLTLAQVWQSHLPGIMNAILFLNKLLLFPIVSINLSSIFRFWSQEHFYILNNTFCLFFRKSKDIFPAFVEFKDIKLYQKCLDLDVDISKFYDEFSYSSSFRHLKNLDFTFFEKQKFNLTSITQNNSDSSGSIMSYISSGLKSIGSFVHQNPYIASFIGVGLSTICLVFLVRSLGYTLSLSKNQEELADISKDILSLATQNELNNTLSSDSFAAVYKSIQGLESEIVLNKELISKLQSQQTIQDGEIQEIKETVQSLIDYLHKKHDEDTSSN